MTFPDFLALLTEYRAIILTLFFAAPWVSYLLCRLVDHDKTELRILNINLLLAVIALLGEIAFITYVSQQYGLDKIVEQTEILFLAAPIYYVGMSLWLSSQRQPLNRLPVFRVIQGLAMIIAAYLFISWLFSRVRIFFFGRLPFSWFLVIVLAALAIGYLGYLKIFGQSAQASAKPSKSNSGKRSQHLPSSVDDELKQLKRKYKR